MGLVIAAAVGLVSVAVVVTGIILYGAFIVCKKVDDAEDKITRLIKEGDKP
jgi:hypothetical protein